MMCGLYYCSFTKFTLLIYRDPLLAELKETTSPNKPLQETLQQAQKAINQFQEKQWKIKGKGVADIVGDTAGKINQYSAVLGPATQVSPFVPSIVWGAFTMFLKVRLRFSLPPPRLIPTFLSSPLSCSPSNFWLAG